MRKIIGLASFFMVVAFQGMLFAETHSVAVLSFANTNKDATLDWLTEGIPETITNDLLNVQGLVLIERLQIRKVMDEQKLQGTGVIDEATVVKLGKLIGADIIVVGAFQKQADQIRLTARFVDVQTAGVLQTAKCTGTMNDIFNLQDQIVKDLIKNLNIELKQDEVAKLAERPTQSLQAYKHYGQGALLQRRKDYQGAVKEFAKAVNVDPAYIAAKEKFNEAYWSLNRNNYWVYSSSSSGYKVESTRTAGGQEFFNGRYVFSYVSAVSIDSRDGHAGTTTSSYYFKGDDGVYAAGSKTNMEYSGGSSSSIIKYDPPFLNYPYDLEVGKTWKSSYKSYSENSDTNMKMVFDNSSEGNVIGKETVTVPAGTFDCYIIEEKYSATLISSSSEYSKNDLGKEMVIVSRIYFSPGIGIVNYQFNKSWVKGDLGSPLIRYHIEE